MTDNTKERFVRKSLAELNAIDNFMFNELMQQEDEEKAKRFVRSIIEPIIGKKIRNIKIESQKMIQGIDVDKHGIQMDAYVRTVVDDEVEEGCESVDVTVSCGDTIFDLEPNTYRDDDKKRARFYHSSIDSRIFLSGKKYSELENVVIIIMTTYDPFGADRMLYTIKNHCAEEPEMEYDDGAVTYFLYTKGKRGIPNEKIKKILHFLEKSDYDNAKDAGMEDALQMIDEIRKNSQIGVKFMHTWDYMNHLRMEAVEEGLAEGIEKGMAQGLAQGMAKGLEEGHAKGMEEGQDSLIAAMNRLKDGASSEELIAEGVDESTVQKAAEFLATLLAGQVG